MQVECAERLGPLIEKPKRVKILVGGRGSTKSTFVADYVLACMSQGQLWCCGREFQNSIDESVHRLLLDEIDRLEFAGFRSDNTHIYHQSGGRNFYKGLARNVRSLKSMLSGVDGLWIEEGESLTDETLRVLTGSVRVSAKDAQRKIAGEEIKMPEIWITMNRGSINDPVSKKLLARAEPSLERCGLYEDDYMMVVEINYDHIPQSWFLASGLEQERQDDWQNMSRAEYDHKWHGKYLESVENAIIKPDWFDACVDAHTKLGFQPQGIEVVAHDPADSGDDKALAYRHGSVIIDARARAFGDVNDACDWATGYAVDVKADEFVWDADGMGLSLKRQVADSLKGKKVTITAFSGGAGVDRPDAKYEPLEGEVSKSKSNRQTFYNKRAQYYWLLRDRMFRTWLAVEKGKYINPDDLISFSSKIPDLRRLRSELCRIPRKENGAGKIQIMNKVQMKQMNIESPNLGDSVMMTLAAGQLHAQQDVDCSVPEAFSAFR